MGKRRRKRVKKAFKCVLSKSGRKKGTKATTCHAMSKAQCRKSKSCKKGK